MSKDLVVELRCQNKDLKQKLQDSKRELNEFKRAVREANSGMSSASSGGGSMFNNILNKITGSTNGTNGAISLLGSGLTKLAGFLGVAMGAAELFNTAIESSNSLGDEMEKIQTQAGAAVNYFGNCLANVDFSNFWQGMNNAIMMAGKLAENLDWVNSELQGLGVRSAEKQLKIAQLQGEAAKLARNDPARQKIYDQIKELQVQDIKETQNLAKKMHESSVMRVASAAGMSTAEANAHRKDIENLLRNRTEDETKKIADAYNRLNNAKNARLATSLSSFAGPGSWVTATQEMQRYSGEITKAQKDLKSLGASMREAQLAAKLTDVSDNKENSPLTVARRETVMALNMETQAQNRLNSTLAQETRLRSAQNRAGGGGGAKKPVYTEGANTTKTIQDNIKWLTEQRDKLDINSEGYQKLTERIQQWQGVLSGAGAQANSLAGLTQQLQAAQNALQNATIGSEQYKAALERVEAAQMKLAEAQRGAINENANTEAAIQRNIQILDEEAKHLELNSEAYRKNRAAREAWQQKLDSAKAPAEGSLAAMQHEAANLQNQLDLQPLTWDMRVNLIDKKEDLERQIGEMQTGIKPSIHVDNGSKEDQAKMQTWQNANVNAQNIKQQYEIGMIGYDKAKADIESLNKQLKEIGLEPVQVEITSKGAQKTEKTLNMIAECVDGVSESFSSLGELAEDPALDVAGIIAGAIANIMLGYAQATAASSSMGPWAWIAFTIAGLATAMSAAASIKSATDGYAGGGVVGGASPIGDRLYARVNSGEMILNGSQQANLFKAIDEGRLGGESTGGEIEFVLRGADLYGSMKNYAHMKARAGKTLKLG